MIYNLSNEWDKQRLLAKVQKCVQAGSFVEFSEKKPKSNNQNRYLHLLIGVVAMECGTSIEYAKAEYFKRLVNGELFVYQAEDRILGTITERLRSINDEAVTSEKLAKAIDKFKMWGREQGFVMPDSEDVRLLALIEAEMGKHKYL